MLSTRILARAAIRTAARPQSLILAAARRRVSTQLGNPAEADAFIKEREAVKQHAAESSDLWRKIALYVTVPCLVLAAVNAYNLWNEHWEHWEHMPPLEERVEYPYQNIRTKNFPWGDGDKTVFWNPKVNYHKREE
ncbi:Cytochrome c oxidase subunit 13, mitochondrial [Rhizina undulata]